MDVENKKSRVAYYFDEDIGNHIYVQLGQYHPLKPFRIEMTDQLIEAYGMKKHMKEYDSTFYGNENIDFSLFHSEDYIDLIKNVTMKNKN